MALASALPEPDPGQRDRRLSIRMNARQDELIRAAADAANKTVSEFVLDSASSAAEQVLMDRRLFVATEEQWAALHTMLDRPAVHKPRLAALLASNID